MHLMVNNPAIASRLVPTHCPQQQGHQRNQLLAQGYRVTSARALVGLSDR